LWQQSRMTGDSMLWQKSWWETRLALLMAMAVLLFFAAWRQPWEEASLTQWVSSLQQRAPNWSEDSRGLLPLLSSYQGYVWLFWFKLMLPVMWPAFALAMGVTLVATSCPWMAGGSGAAGLFTFSLPVSRRRVLLTHVALVAVEMVLVTLVPSLMFPIVGGMVFPAFSFLLMAVFNNQWKALTIGIASAFAMFFPIRIAEEFPWWNVYHVMSGETYFRYGKIPWLGLLVSLAVSASMVFAAVRIYERRDF
jgi:hypothetical protein